MDGATLLSKFEAEIDGKRIQTQIKEKNRAREEYEDAVAGGNTAVMAERSKKKKEETLTLKLGNLLPGQEATLRLQIVNQMEIIGGHYAFTLPMAFYPDYKKHGVQAEDFVYDFSYKVNITAQGSISSLSLPESAEVTYKNETKT